MTDVNSMITMIMTLSDNHDNLKSYYMSYYIVNNITLD